MRTISIWLGRKDVLRTAVVSLSLLFLGLLGGEHGLWELCPGIIEEWRALWTNKRTANLLHEGRPEWHVIIMTVFGHRFIVEDLNEGFDLLLPGFASHLRIHKTGNYIYVESGGVRGRPLTMSMISVAGRRGEQTT